MKPFSLFLPYMLFSSTTKRITATETPGTKNVMSLPIIQASVKPYSTTITASSSIKVVLTDDNIHEAVQLWLDHPQQAKAEYGGKPIGEWNTSLVTNMDNLFQDATMFDEDLSAWNTERVTSMEYTFAGCQHFNSPLNSWNVEQVTSMKGMFSGCISFNQDLDAWKTSALRDLTAAFKGATQFNGSLKGWDTSKVTSMAYTFYSATFLEGTSMQNWDVSSATSMMHMFSSATMFQADLSRWNPQSVTSFEGMFAYAASFTGIKNTSASNGNPAATGRINNNFFMDISGNNEGYLSLWNVGSAQMMERMFYDAKSFVAEICWDDSLPAGVSGMDMFCGSSGSFSESCQNVPWGSEDCQESWQEIEEDEEVRDEQVRDEETTNIGSDSNSLFINDWNSKPSSAVHSYGGSGGIGAMNPGSLGRDPESTATIVHNPNVIQNSGDNSSWHDTSFGESSKQTTTEYDEFGLQSDTEMNSGLEVTEFDGLVFVRDVSSSAACHSTLGLSLMMMGSIITALAFPCI